MMETDNRSRPLDMTLSIAEARLRDIDEYLYVDDARIENEWLMLRLSYRPTATDDYLVKGLLDPRVQRRLSEVENAGFHVIRAGLECPDCAWANVQLLVRFQL